MKNNRSRWYALLLVVLSIMTPSVAQNTKYVNLFIGTSGDNGQVAPGAAAPFGMVCVCPDNDPRSHAGYDYAVTKVSGISVNRLSGVGCSGGGGNLRIRPVAPSQELHIKKSREKATPGYYSTAFTNGIKTELTATNAMAVERYKFPRSLSAALWIDFASTFEDVATCHYKRISETCIEGYVQAKNVCGHGRYKLYFSLNTSHPFQLEEQKETTACLTFGKKVRSVEVRIGLSALSSELASWECARWEKMDFEDVKSRTADQWEKQLSAIDVKGGKKDDRVIFYTSLYRTYLSPADVSSPDGAYLGTDGKVYISEDFRYYSNWSLWDTFRTKFPLLVLTEPAKMRDMATSLIHLYATGKKDWSTGFESTPTVRTEHAVILLLDAYRKGITNLDFRKGYAGMKQEMERLPMRSPDQKMESAYDLWAMAKIAEIIGEKADSEQYRQRSVSLFEETWKKEFMNVTPAFEVMKNNGLYQGTRWQYRWAAPQYIDKMIEWVGQDSLRLQLTYFFDHHLYNQGNEPDIHVPYLFNRLGAPEKTQQIVRSLMTEPMIHKYGGNSEFKTPYLGKAFKNAPEGYSPEMDEDDGTMSAWYVFGAMGLYPLLVGDEYYDLTSPLFDRVLLRLTNGNVLTIQTEGRKKKDAPIKSIHFNGKKIADYRISHNELIKGGELIYNYK
ncbi:glycoside hydrolase family 92 protein [Bacteroides thetaiotaomicron]|jgi:alpha-1,2-mannosidase|uniref:glycoside hydrolase domain-containing protein n=1 Tax=Bacteroides thetaiotaomicron TaxID=818 RepID=UPI000907FB30|nr:glycoside hydrolase domain-containing protein [Bacteroides thetaiotaomicron]MCE8735142.1 glycoside hydrolase family 92 protein [Bacteroides thetaiotaomicron]MCE9202667.1 glycoside hydrolase family 92 protein [Bacteroides thetaiotaomicron]MCF2732135.1 glycoside hydrolase family 92 protein [Bacteroides thetaiotaomicron]MCS2616903.1 glycoside hydrolase family 92 protein [Bacteroides thetaiotaomicron]MDC2152169.1 glycoside hydrolase family 92 protein [Bacteroides thetaiotaomicron]